MTTSDPLSCTVRGIGVRRPVVIAPAVRPNVQRFLIDGDGARLDRARAPPPRRGAHLAARRGGRPDRSASSSAGGGCGSRSGARSPSGPHLSPTTSLWPRPRAAHFGLSESTPIGDEVYRSVRPYVRGDSRRRVHWKASAHHGSLMVKESDGTGIVSLRIVLQLDAPGVGRGGRPWPGRRSSPAKRSPGAGRPSSSRRNPG